MYLSIHVSSVVFVVTHLFLCILLYARSRRPVRCQSQTPQSALNLVHPAIGSVILEQYVGASTGTNSMLTVPLEGIRGLNKLGLGLM